MEEAESSRPDTGATVLVLAPLARDATAARDFLAGAGIPTEACADMEALCAALLQTPRVVLATEEALTAEALARLSAALAEQLVGTGVPVLILVAARPGVTAEQRVRYYADALGNVTLITRPVHPVTLLSVVQTALRAHARCRAWQRTERARPPAAARPVASSAEAHRRIVDTIPLATFVTLVGRVVHANPAAAALLGASDAARLIGQSLVDWVHPDLAAATEQQLAELTAGLRSTVTLEQRWLRVGGAAIDVAVTAAALPWNEQTAVQLHVQDLSTRQAADDHSRLRQALQSAPVTLFQQDRDLRYTWIHNAYAGRSAADFTGRRDSDWLPVTAEAEALHVFKRQIIESGIGGRRRFRLTHDDGRHDFEFIIEPALDPAGQPAGIIGAALCIDEYVALQEQLRRQTEQLARMDQRKNDFIAQLAHELRNPLAPIHNAVHVLKIQPDPPDAAHLKWALEVIGRQVQHLSRLVDDLLDIARVTHGGLKLHPEPLELGRVLAQAIEAARPSTAARQQVLTYSPPIEPIRVLADPTRLLQVVGNLLSNAARYTPTGGHVALSVRREDDRAVITVTDDGFGIAPEVLPHIFDPFYRGERAAVHAQTGLGLGLTLVRQLVALHGGTIEAHSEGLDRGSEFSVRLPVVQELPPPARTPAVRAAPASGLRIMVVDDDPDVAQSFALLLRTMGHEVEAVSDGASALARAETFRPHVMFIDLVLPGIDGYELAASLRADPAAAGIRLVALTGYVQEEVRRRALAVGFDEHLPKPATVEAVEQLLASFAGSD